MAIEENELLPLFVRCCPGLRDRLVRRVDYWLYEDGTIAMGRIACEAADFLVERLDEGDYSFADDLVALIERLLAEGSQTVQDIAATQFLEAVSHQQRLPPELWVPLIGPRAREYLRAWDKFTGATTPGLDGPH